MPRRRWPAWTSACLLLALTLAGCAGEPGLDGPGGEQAGAPMPEQEGTTRVAAGPAPFVWPEDGRSSVLDVAWDTTTFAFDVLCAMGGEWYFERTGGPVANGTAVLEFVVTAGAAYTGRQIGWQLDEGNISWFDPVPALQTGTFSVDVDASMWEEGAQRWTIWYRDTLPAGPDLCYTGISAGGGSVHVVAVRG